ncbi:MAG: acetoacetate--CoA ligase [Alphaproteobacteria bacterium]|nr:acetoacetate--CoA ligase [Alphaproteobacteria bacterium]
MENAIWQPTQEQIKKSNLRHFMSFVNQRHHTDFEDYAQLYKWSIEYSDFWSDLWDFCGVIGEKKGPVLSGDGTILGSIWFKESKLNFAENLLRRRDTQKALVFWGENRVKKHINYQELYDETSKFRSYLENNNIGINDRIAAFMPNMPETIIAMLGASSMGAVWSSCSPDFGIEGIVDRFGQIEPKILIAVDSYVYNGKLIDCSDKILALLDRLPSLSKILIVNYMGNASIVEKLQHHPKIEFWSDIVTPLESKEIIFERFDFNHPLYIMFSSGTTGVPKCIVHGAGGTLLQHLKEHQLHCDVKKDDRLFYFTTCGWMMWNWLVTGLASQACLLLYDGSPFFPKGNILFDLAQSEKMTHFGCSAKYIEALKKIHLKPIDSYHLMSLRMMMSTGSPLVPESYDFVYTNIKEEICLASISGGTDIVSCFALGCPILPVYRGELQVRGLGMAVDVFDDEGKSIVGQKGELVCTKPFPARPLYFWNDPDGEKFKNAYFKSFPNLWAHGDYVELTMHGGMIFYGRSDAVLNPGGVRIGTAEIYRQVEQIDDVLESLAIGQDWHGDVRVVLFVKLKEGKKLDVNLVDLIKNKIKLNASPRHVPSKIIEIADIPRTKSGKIVELAVRDIVHGRIVKNKEALANPEALDLYENITDLQS